MKKSLTSLLSLLLCLALIPGTFVHAQNSCIDVVHVSPAGSNTADCGSENAPCQTIGFGIQRAANQGFSSLRVATGVYQEIVELASGISLWGGYDATDWQRTGFSTIRPATNSTIGGRYITLSAVNVSAPTVVSDFRIEGQSITAASTNILSAESSYAVYALNSGGLHVQRSVLVGGQGAQGRIGNPGTSAPSLSPAPGGAQGQNGDEPVSCTTVRRNGGNGGNNTCPAGRNPDGGRGGNGGQSSEACNPFDPNDATPGLAGSNAPASPGGQGGNGGGLCNTNAGSGQNGTTLHGNRGSGGAGGIIAVNFWRSNRGSHGTTGDNGNGGGGGGGGGGCNLDENDRGPGGGGGGAGGCRAIDFGDGGSGGGGAFGLFSVNAPVSLRDVEIILGNGGAGGRGGNGGTGQPGGTGGLGGNASEDSGPGGRGGDGGSGGHSGSGGGGAGGPSYGIYSVSSSPQIAGLTFNVAGAAGGMGGQGGNGATAVQDGLPGANGIVLNTNGTVPGALVIQFDPCSDALPVELLAFTAERANGKAVLLRWSTASEAGHQGFYLERATADQNFTRLAFIDQAQEENQTGKHYTFNDQGAPSSVIYYRLQQVDQDGSISYSPIRSVAGSSSGLASLRVSPNPFSGELTVQFPTAGYHRLEVYRADGSLLLHQNLEVEALEEIRMETNKWPRGIYFLSLIRKDGERTVKKVVK